MTYRNLTRHSITISNNSATFTIIPDGTIAEPQNTEHDHTATNNIDTIQLSNTTVPELPQAKPGTTLIVDRIIAHLHPERPDLVFPHRPTYDQNQNVVSYAGLARITAPTSGSARTFDISNTPKIAAEALDLKAGDVILTSTAGAFPGLLRAGLKSPVSHAAIMITADLAIEARDDRYDLSDQGGRIYIRTVTELLESPGLNRFAVRRPPHIDHTKLLAFAIENVENSPHFASAGLAMTGILRILDATNKWTSRKSKAEPTWHRVNKELEEDVARWAEAVADGPFSMVCTELVYRALHAAGCELVLDNAVLRRAMTHLPNTTSTPSIERDKQELLQRFVDLSEHRPPQPGFPKGTSKQQTRLTKTAANNIHKRVRRRLQDNADGDKADLVTPADLYQLPPLTTIADLRLVPSAQPARARSGPSQ